MADRIQPDIFSVQLIWETLGKYLNQTDFFNLRRVNFHFKNHVDDCLHFQEQSWRSVWMVISNVDECYIQENTSIKCKNIRVVFVKSNSDKIRSLNAIPSSELINKFTKGLKFSILFEGTLTSTNLVIGSPSAVTTAMKKIMKPMEILNNLKINSFVFGAMRADGTWDNLSKLKYFAVFLPAMAKVEMTFSERQQLIENFTFVADKMKCLNIFTGGGLKDSTPLCPSICTILIKSVSTLTFLDIRQPKCWSLLGDSVNITFPSLRTLKFKALYSNDKEILTTFLRNQPLLEHLDVGWDRIPRAFYDVICQKSTKLRTFHIKAKSFGPGEEAGGWRFLNQMDSLDNFQMKRPKSSNENIATFDQILQVLPKRSVRRIHLRGLDGRTPINVRHLEQFTNLQELSLMRCTSAVNDSTLENISRISRFQRDLEVLEISLCDVVSNSGIHQLVSLKALRKLVIKGCSRITDAGMRQLYFPGLKHFDLSYNANLTKDGLLAAVKTNPSLEFFLGSWRIDSEYYGSNKSSIQFRTSYKKHDRGGRLDSDSEAE